MKKLSRNELKHIKGGDGSGGSCSMTYQNPSGQWITEQGTCQEAYYDIWGPSNPGSVIVPYCSTKSFTGPVELSSNGGVSRCGAPYASL